MNKYTITKVTYTNNNIWNTVLFTLCSLLVNIECPVRDKCPVRDTQNERIERIKMGKLKN